MTELHFKGKEFVYNHHLTVPHRPLVPHPDKGIGAARLDGNLIIQGDNLHALKALLPTHAGKVDCIFIDPPYNTGNEGWCYNDNVNSPMIKEWLAGNPIGIEDGLRHDKWCAMMWPRLRLLHEMLTEDGIIFVSIDDHESSRLESLLEDVFGPDGNLGRFIVQLNPKGRHLDTFLAKTHEFVLVFAKSAEVANLAGVVKDERMQAEYDEADERGSYRPIELRNRNSAFNPETRPGLYFPLFVDPATGSVSLAEDENHVERALPHDSNNEPTCWTWSPPKIEREGDLLVGRATRAGVWRIFRKDYLIKDGAEATTKPKTIWLDPDLNMDAARKTITTLLGAGTFDFPKPVPLVQRLIQLVANPNAIVLDSFAGSGTTAHAVLEANRRDGGNRRFILVEMEDFADRLTAERVRRVIKGYPFKGTQKTELHRESLTWAKLQNADRLTETVEKIETLHGHEYTKITKRIDGGDFIVTGERMVEERAAGLGGEFTYCTLGDPIDMDRILTGGQLPPFVDLGTVLFHTATSQTCDPAQMNAETGYLGEAAGQKLWLIYRDDLEWLKSATAALTLSFAQQISADDPVSRHIVFAPANHTSPNLLRHHRIGNVEFAPLPYALYRVERG